MSPPSSGQTGPKVSKSPLARARTLVIRYGMALAITALAALIRVLLLPWTGHGAPYLMFFGATLAVSYGYGPGPGILSSVIGAYLGPQYFGVHEAHLAPTGPPWAQMALFFLEGVSVSLITHGFGRSRETIRANAAELRRSEERYQMAALATLDCIWDWNQRTGRVSYSEPLHTVFLYPRSAAYSHYSWWLDKVHPDDVERVRKSLEHTFVSRRQKWSQEYRFANAEGRYLVVNDRGWVMYGNDGKPERMIGAMQNVTQEREGQKVISEASARLRLVTDALPALVSYVETDGRHRFVSAEYERWFGRPRGAILDRRLEEFWPAGASSDQLRRGFRRAVAGEPVRFEDTVPHPKRGQVHISSVFVPDFDDAGQVRGIVCLIHDVTEQKHIERVLRESEEHYRVLAEVVPQIIWESRSDGAFTYVNSQWLRYAGMPPKDTFGFGWLQAVHPSQREKVLQGWRRQESSPREWENEVLLRRHEDGAYRWHLLRALAPQDSDGKGVRKWIGSLIDIHERKQAAQELQTLANFLPQLAWVADHAGQVAWFNQRWYDYTGSQLSAMRGEGWLEMVHPEHREAVREGTQRAWRTGVSYEATFPMRGVDGGWQWFLTRAIPIHDGSGKVHRWFGTCTDINEQLEVQTRLERAQTALKTAVRARDQFLSIASHELKTPLTSLHLVAQMAERNLDRNTQRACEPVRVRKLVEQTGRSVARLTRLVDDMLDSSRIAMGKLSFKTEHFDLTGLIHEVVERTGPQLSASGSSITVNAPGPILGDWDRFRIEQVVINLLTNAMRYGEGSPITVDVAQANGIATVRVGDGGPGVAQGQQARIFEQFERATPHSSISGLGLGLFICKEIVERHGGSIGVESVPGVGATFVVHLPLVPQQGLRQLDFDQDPNAEVASLLRPKALA